MSSSNNKKVKLINYEDQQVKRELILDHYDSPKNKIEEKDVNKYKKYKKANINSNSYIDNLTAYIDIVDGKIKDIKFSGIGCAISTASTDIIINLLRNKTIKQANEIILNYLNMINNKKYDKNIIKELVVFNNVNKQINRIKCATIGIEAIQKALNSVDHI